MFESEVIPNSTQVCAKCASHDVIEKPKTSVDPEKNRDSMDKKENLQAPQPDKKNAWETPTKETFQTNGASIAKPNGAQTNMQNGMAQPSIIPSNPVDQMASSSPQAAA